ncbi:MAG: CPBP family intramembrane metalloprotease, partial [Deltaproteobacteria bacterium]
RIPVTQLAGGVVFAVAYEKTGSLMAPVMIHILGNLSIFTLALVV